MQAKTGDGRKVSCRYNKGVEIKTKRGRPPIGAERVKGDYLDIRVGSSEKAGFRDAAELAGHDLSAWVRERLRAVARKELEAAGLPVAFLAKHAEGRNEQS